MLTTVGLHELVSALVADGYAVIGPQLADSAIVYEPMDSAEQLPVGWVDEQDGGRYRLVASDRPALFDYVVGPHSWKKFLFPPRQQLWRARRGDDGFTIETPEDETPRYAFIGVRSCEIRAMQIQDRVFANDAFTDPVYAARREAAFIVAVNCGRPAGTCFCLSTNSGPRAADGFDLALTELIDDRRHEFLVEVGSARGAQMLSRVPQGQRNAEKQTSVPQGQRNAEKQTSVPQGQRNAEKQTSAPQRPATAADHEAARAVSDQAAASMGRELPVNAADILKNNPEHPRWDEVAERCLSCGNCTMVCPTCFCSAVEDTTDLSGETAERTRRWDSCFNTDFSYIHGGSVRTSARSRYRQWLTHKLAYWHDQFDSSGCVGCGRCISWCPVGIDITEEVRAMQTDSSIVQP